MNRKRLTAIATLVAALSVAVAIAPVASAAPVAKAQKLIEQSADLQTQAIREQKS